MYSIRAYPGAALGPASPLGLYYKFEPGNRIRVGLDVPLGVVVNPAPGTPSPVPSIFQSGDYTYVRVDFPHLTISNGDVVRCGYSYLGVPSVRMESFKVRDGVGSGRHYMDLELGTFLARSDSPLPWGMAPAGINIPPKFRDERKIQILSETPNDIFYVDLTDSPFIDTCIRANARVEEEDIKFFYRDGMEQYPARSLQIGCVTLAEAAGCCKEVNGALAQLGGTLPRETLAKYYYNTLQPKAEIREMPIAKHNPKYWPGDIVLVESARVSPRGKSFHALILEAPGRTNGTTTYRVLPTEQGNDARESLGHQRQYPGLTKNSKIAASILEIEQDRIAGAIGYLNSKSPVHSSIGVVVTKTFSFEGKEFPAGSVGKLFGFVDDYQCAHVQWHTPNALLWNVPTEHLSLCELIKDKSLSLREASDTFGSIYRGAREVVFRTGDLLVYSNNSPLRWGGNQAIAKGTLLRAQQDFIDRPDHAGVVSLVDGISGESELGKGAKINVSRRSVAKFQHPWFEGGRKVVVKGEVSFKSKNLSLLKGKVLIHTDVDGDVGVEFVEEIPGAGSFDGLGKSGHCLFIPAASLTEESE